MLGLIARINSDFGISVLVTSHLLGELERVCDHIVVIDGGQLLRASSTADVTAVSEVVVVEVDEPADPLAALLEAAGLTVRVVGRLLEVELRDDSAYDVVREHGGQGGSRAHPDGAAPASHGRDLRDGRERPVSTPTPSAGVIHDIGYRHYAGERRGRRYIRRSLYADSLRGAYGLGRSARNKITPTILLAVMCLPAAVMVAITAATRGNELVGDYTSYVLNLQMVVLIFVAAQAPAIVSRDLRFGVMSLYFSRPLERVDYVVAKYLAMASAVFVLTAAPLTIMFVGALIVGLPISEQVPDYLRAAGGAGAPLADPGRRRPWS